MARKKKTETPEVEVDVEDEVVDNVSYNKPSDDDLVAISFGNSIKSLRERKGISQKDLCDKINKDHGVKISQQYLSSVESGKRSPSLTRMAHFAETLGVPLGVLVTGIGSVTNRLVLTLPKDLAQSLAPLQELPVDSDMNTQAGELLSRFARLDASSATLRAFVDLFIDQFDNYAQSIDVDTLRCSVAAASAAHILASGNYSSSNSLGSVNTQPVSVSTTQPIPQENIDGEELPPGFTRDDQGNVILDLGREAQEKGHDAMPNNWETGNDGIPVTTIAVAPTKS